MSNLTRETAFVPLLGSSNGLFLAITAVFFCFCMGPVPEEAQNTLLSTLFLSGKRIEGAVWSHDKAGPVQFVHNGEIQHMAQGAPILGLK